MSEIKISRIRVSEFVTNCFICANVNTKECFIVDPGDNGMGIKNKIVELGYEPKAILLTHGHLDHMGASEYLKEAFDIPIIASSKEEQVLTDSRANLTAYFADAYTIKADIYLDDEEMFEYAGFSIKMLLTPGHTCGSCCYYLEEQGVLFSGDTIFYASRGRNDFPTGNAAQHIRSIKDKLLVLPEDTIVYSGHGEDTTIGNERLFY